VWEELDGHRSLSEIIERLTVEYAVDVDQAATDLSTLLNSLCDKGLVEVRS
jgi:predicted transcriptional regulator